MSMEPVASKAHELPWQEQEVAELRAELHLMKTAGIIEVAVRNPSVAEYMAHWEARAEAAEARVKELEGAIRWAHETLYEINPSNYDHSEVCKINDASVEVILGLAPLLDERHGKPFEWWVKYSTEEATRRATTAEAEAERLRALVEEAKRVLESFGDAATTDEEVGRCDPEDNRILIVQAHGCQLAELSADHFRAARDLHDRLGVEG